MKVRPENWDHSYIEIGDHRDGHDLEILIPNPSANKVAASKRGALAGQRSSQLNRRISAIRMPRLSIQDK